MVRMSWAKMAQTGRSGHFKICPTKKKKSAQGKFGMAIVMLMMKTFDSQVSSIIISPLVYLIFCL